MDNFNQGFDAKSQKKNGGNGRGENKLSPSELLDTFAGQNYSGVVVQDYSPIHKSLDWHLSTMFWERNGLGTFTSGEVPYAVTNDGAQASNAVEVYRASLISADAEGTREKVSYVLELGSGSGLFAKLFLDQLADACSADGSDHYERTIYLVSDGSSAMLEDTRNSGVFEKHETKVRRIPLTLPNIESSLSQAFEDEASPFGFIRAIHANYVLDSLPFTVLLLDDQEIGELHIRSHLDLDPGPNENERTLISNFLSSPRKLDEIERQRLHKLHDSIELEAIYRSISRNDLPFGDAIPKKAKGENSSLFLHSFGALQCLEQACQALIENGHIIVQDYGITKTVPATEAIEFQQFGRSVASGLNFSQMGDFVAQNTDATFFCPATDPESLHARLIGRNISSETEVVFKKRYSAENWRWQSELSDEGRKLAEDCFFEAARSKFAEAYRRVPYNWVQTEIYASFLIYSAEDYEAALHVLQRCMELNHLSPSLWNMLGDCYYFTDEIASSAEFYQHAININEREIQGRINLAYVAEHNGEYKSALVYLAEALGLDENLDYTEAILNKQSEVHQKFVQYTAERSLKRLNRLSGHRELNIQSILE